MTTWVATANATPSRLGSSRASTEAKNASPSAWMSMPRGSHQPPTCPSAAGVSTARPQSVVDSGGLGPAHAHRDAVDDGIRPDALDDRGVGEVVDRGAREGGRVAHPNTVAPMAVAMR